MGNCFLTNRAGNAGGGITITFDLYSASNDTVYYLDNGNPVTLCVTDSTGKATGVSLTIPREGKTITLWSTVANNPSNLAQKYSQSVNFTNNFSGSVYLMPYGAKYWFGNRKAPYSTTKYMDPTGSPSWNNQAPTFNTNSISASISAVMDYSGYGLTEPINRTEGSVVKVLIQSNRDYNPYLARVSGSTYYDPQNTNPEARVSTGTTTLTVKELATIANDMYFSVYGYVAQAGYTVAWTIYAIWVE